MGGIYGVAEVVNCAQLERFDGIGNLTLARNHDGWEVDTHLPDFMQQFEPVLAWHSQVRDQNMRIEAVDQFQRPHPVLGDLPLKSPSGNRLAPAVVTIDVILGDQNSNFGCHLPSLHNSLALVQFYVSLKKTEQETRQCIFW